MRVVSGGRTRPERIAFEDRPVAYRAMAYCALPPLPQRVSRKKRACPQPEPRPQGGRSHARRLRCLPSRLLFPTHVLLVRVPVPFPPASEYSGVLLCGARLELRAVFGMFPPSSREATAFTRLPSAGALLRAPPCPVLPQGRFPFPPPNSFGVLGSRGTCAQAKPPQCVQAPGGGLRESDGSAGSGEKGEPLKHPAFLAFVSSVRRPSPRPRFVARSAGFVTETHKAFCCRSAPPRGGEGRLCANGLVRVPPGLCVTPHPLAGKK